MNEQVEYIYRHGGDQGLVRRQNRETSVNGHIW